MRNLMERRRNKKGFTLAELLIVVAIIAVLVAIAIPIFMNSLAKAEKAAELANIRSAKAAGINKILSEFDSGECLGYTDGATKGTRAVAWNIYATIKDGDITECKVTPLASGATPATQKVEKTDSATGDGYVYTITCSVKDVEVTKS